MKLGRGNLRGTSPFARAAMFVWTRLHLHQVSIFVPNHPLRPKQQRIMLSFTLGLKGKQATIDLTALTAPELLALRETVLLAMDLAAPIVEQLDMEAQEKADDGDDSDARIYRGLPRVVVRQRTLREYDEGLLRRHADALPGNVLDVIAGKPVEEGDDGVDESIEAD